MRKVFFIGFLGVAGLILGLTGCDLLQTMFGTQEVFQQYSLEIQIEGEGSIAIESSRQSAAIGMQTELSVDSNQSSEDSVFRFNQGAQIELIASAESGWGFSEWAGDGDSSEDSLSVTMDGDKTIIAVFLQSYTLSIDTVGSGTVNVSPDQESYLSASLVELTAIPETGFSFSEWTGDVGGSENPLMMTMDSGKNITAVFTQETYSITVNMSGNGVVSISPDQSTYQSGSIVELTATAESGWIFSEWLGDVGGSENPLTVTMDSEKDVTAVFTDTSDPSAPTINGISSGIYNSSQSFTITGDAGGTIEFSVDGAISWTTYSGEITLGIEGTYYITARQIDASGTTSSNAATITVTLDFTYPSTPTIDGINEGTYSTAQSFTTSGESGATIEYSLDGGSNWLNYDGEILLSNDGTYEITARQTDAAGNTSNNAVAIIVNMTAEYAIGDTGPAGGIVFYDKGSYVDGWRYLEAAPASTEWEELNWGSYGTNIAGADGITIGTGEQNNADIMAVQGIGSTTGGQLCDAFSYGGFDDWFLPSKEELNEMYIHKAAIGGFVTGGIEPNSSYYWSSSEYNNHYSWAQTFEDGNGDQFYYQKYNYARVRAVRAF